jgi:PHD/YefM family antitoxin component YafN of YafNO toxin-antitoxin module
VRNVVRVVRSEKRPAEDSLEETGRLGDLRSHPDSKINHEAIAITEGGKPVLAVLPWETYESPMETLEILSDPAAMAAIRAGEEAITRGKTVPWEQVKVEALRS